MKTDDLDCSIPASYELVYSAEQIASRVSILGKEVSAWARDVRSKSGADVVAIPVLRGGIFFFSDLVRAIDTSVEICPIRTVAYEVGEIGVGTQEVSVSGEVMHLKGRSVLLLDEICESGRTFEKLYKVLHDAGAAEVRSAVLIKRDIDRETFDPSWVGFNLKNEAWCVGFGMDDRERWRNLPGIYVIRKD